MVVADHLLAEGDPRGDLIVLDHAERRGLLTEPAAIEQLLVLAAEYSFPRAAPEDPPFPWEQRAPDHYVGNHGDARYAVRLDDNDAWELEVDRPIDGGFVAELADLHSSVLDERYLEILGDVIRADAPFDGLSLARDAVPQYEGGPLRCYRLPLEFLLPRGYLRNRFGLAARDYHRWHAIWQRLRVMQPAEHDG
jgi:hypothetical protein